jgi:transcriptional regulator with XRE-family HTH domain
MVNEGRHITNRLKFHRKIAGFRQQDVAYYLGHSSSSRIIKWEKGLATPGINNLIKLSILYGTLIEELYYDLFNVQKDILAKKKRCLQVSKGQSRHFH